MALNQFECPLCGYVRESFRKDPKCNHNQDEEGIPIPLTPMRKLIAAPQAKFLEPTNKEHGKSQLKDQKKILMERAKEHARLNDYHDLAQANSPEMAKAQGWVREDGTVKKKLDSK